jgi:hypothetical protein
VPQLSENTLKLLSASARRTLSQSGDRGKAIEYYTRFVELWKDADPGLQPSGSQRPIAVSYTRA